MLLEPLSIQKTEWEPLVIIKWFSVAVICCTSAIFVYGLRIFQRFKFRHIPGPSPPWLVGEVPFMKRLGQPRAFQMWGERHGPGMHSVHLAGLSVLHVNQPETARKVLHGSLRPKLMNGDVMPKALLTEVNNGLFWNSGSEWRDLRAAWQPIFFTGSLENYMPIFDKAATLLAEEMSWAASENQFVDMHSLVQDMALNVICQAAFGVDLHMQAADKAEAPEEDRARLNDTREAGKRFFLSQETSVYITAARLFPFMIPVIRLLAYRFPDKALKNKVVARKLLIQAAANLVTDHRSSLETQPNTMNVRPQGARKGVEPGSFIDLLVKGSDRVTGKGFPDSTIVQQVTTMLLVGFETTANMLSFTMYLLARPCNTEKQAKLTAEVDALGKDWTATFSDVHEKLPYMDAVLKESLRLYPPGHLLFREAEADTLVEGYKVPKGSYIFISAYAIHNDPRVWGDDVATFLPERWLTEDPVAAKKAKSSFFGFGDGPRVCPGNRFALTEAKMALVRVYQKCTVELEPGQEPLALRDSITMSPKHGVSIRPVPRM